MSKVMDFNLECNRVNRRISKAATAWLLKHIDKSEYDWEWQQKLKFSYVRWTGGIPATKLICIFRHPGGGHTERAIDCKELGLDLETVKGMKRTAKRLEDGLKGGILKKWNADPVGSLIYPDTQFGWIWWGKAKKHWVRIEDTSDWEQTKVIPVTMLTRNGGLWEETETWQRVDKLDEVN